MAVPPPEVRVEEQQHRADLEPAHQHQERQHQLRGRTQPAVMLNRTDTAAGPGEPSQA